MCMTISIKFKQNKRIQEFQNELILKKIYYDKQINNYIFNEKDINIIQYYIIYYNLSIINHEFFVKQYIKLFHILDKNEINKLLMSEYSRFNT